MTYICFRALQLNGIFRKKKTINIRKYTIFWEFLLCAHTHMHAKTHKRDGRADSIKTLNTRFSKTSDKTEYYISLMRLVSIVNTS